MGVRSIGTDPLMRVSGLAKTFPNGTRALRGVDLGIEAGQVHGLLGANGAGKSTLIRILSGAASATAGTIEWRGKPVVMTSPTVANTIGIATIYQHIPVVPRLSVLENVFLGAKTRWRHSRDDLARYRDLCARLEYDLNPAAEVSDLSIGQRQMVSIMKALVIGADLVIMDEPTASLAVEERELVYRVVRRLTRQEGKAVLFVSHFLDEVLDLTDTVSILRDGACVMRAETADLTEARLAEAIVGKEVIALERAIARHPKPAAPGAAPDAPRLAVRNLASPGRFQPMSFDLAKGEVLGIAGLLGSGRTELLHAIYGSDADATGEVLIDGQRIPQSPIASVKAGMALVGEDRSRDGLFPNFEIWRNITLPSLRTVSRMRLFPDKTRELARAQDTIRRLSIKAESPDTLVTELSGGNAQKVALGRWLNGPLKLFLLDEPTVGIDIGSKTEILKLLRDVAEAGTSVIVVSSEFEELLAVCDRILVLRDGTLRADLPAAGTTEHELLLHSGGSRSDSADAAAVPSTGRVENG